MGKTPVPLHKKIKILLAISDIRAYWCVVIENLRHIVMNHAPLMDSSLAGDCLSAAGVSGMDMIHFRIP